MKQYLQDKSTYRTHRQFGDVGSTWTALCSPGLIRGACRRKLVNLILKPIYGGTGIKASQRFRSDPRVAHKPMLRAAN
jgi:hypothetical protein